MRKNQYYQHKKHCSYFSLYWSFGLEPTLKTKNDMRELNGTVCIVASKKGVHKHAVNRNFAKRRLRATLRNFLKTESLPLVTLRIVAKKEILSCSFADLNLMLHKNLKAI